MIRKVCSKLPDSGAMGRSMNYALKKAALVGGSEVKFEGTSIKDYVKLGVKKCDQVNNKYEASTGRNQEVKGLHEIISFDATDKITPEKAAELALGVWRDVLDIDKHRHRWAVHTDTDKIHVHLIWNKRDNGGKVYEQLHDYALFEKALHKTEIENGLKVVEDRKFLKPGMPTNPQPSNEYRLENRGIKSEKSKFKEAVNAATDKALTAGEFLEFLHADGYTLILNGSQGYSLEKEGQIFKASEVGASYKLLKARFGDDSQFTDTLARLGVKKAPEREMGGISFNMYVTQEDIDQYETKKKKSNRVLDTRFDSHDGHDFYFKDSNKKAFEYSASRGRVDFNNTSPMAIKAGLQKLTENMKPQELQVNGPEYAKRQIWLQFHLMELDKRGYSLGGYTATAADKAELEKMKLESPAFKKLTEQNKIKATDKAKLIDAADAIKGGSSEIASKAAATAASVFDSRSSDQVAALNKIQEELKKQKEMEKEREKERIQNNRRRNMKLKPQ